MRNIVGLVGALGALVVSPAALAARVEADPAFRTGQFSVTRLVADIGPTTATIVVRGTINRAVAEATGGVIRVRPVFHLQQLCRPEGTSEVPSLVTWDTNPAVSTFENTQVGPDLGDAGNRLRWTERISYDPLRDLSLNLFVLPDGTRVPTVCPTGSEPAGEIAIAGAALELSPGLGPPPATKSGGALLFTIDLPVGHTVVRP